MVGKPYPSKKLGEVLIHSRRPITPTADRSYDLIGVRWYAAGTHLHDRIEGAKLQAPTLWEVREGDIIYNKMWTSKGAFSVVSKETSGLFSTSEYPVFETTPHVSKEFLRYSFQQTRFWRLAEAWTNGTTERARLNPRDFLKLPLSLPPISEQRAITEVLSSVEDAIAKTEELIEVISRTLNSTLNWVLGTSKAASASIINFGEIIESTKYGTSAKCDDDSSGFPVLRIPNVLSGGIDQAELKYAKLPANEAAKFTLRDGDILAVRTNGNPKYVGRMALIGGLPKDTIYASYIIRIRVDPKKALPEFVWLCSETYPLRNSLTSAATTSAGNFNINSNGLRSAKIPLPSLAEQRRIVDAAETLRSRRQHEIDYLDQLRKTHAALAQELLSGRTRLPASVIARHRDDAGQAA
jgi:type I restriction enzyme S subunit